MGTQRWTSENMQNQTGRVAIVTGANTGIGFENARALAKKGAVVIMACRDEKRASAAAESIVAEQPSGSVEVMLLDLADLGSVNTFADAFHQKYDRLDLLINNAGVMIPPSSKTSEGFELQIGVNFLGHFALTGLLFDLLDTTEGSRVVTLSSIAHRNGHIDFDSFVSGGKSYKAIREYSQSKLACLMFALEMQRRLEARGSKVESLASHPGGTKTDLQRHNGFVDFITQLMAMETEQGSLPTLFAATAPEARGGEYIGPDGFFEFWGFPKKAKISSQALDSEVSQELWSQAEDHTGVRFLS